MYWTVTNGFIILFPFQQKRKKKSLVAFHRPSPFCSLDRSRVRLPLDSRSRFRSRSHSLARSHFCSLARAFASRSNLARVFVRGLARSLARSHDSPNPKVHAMVHFRRLTHETHSERMRPQARWLGQHACIHTQSWTRT